MRKTKLIAAVSALSVLALAACADDGDGNGNGNGDDDAAVVTTDSGLKVTGEPGKKPKVDVPKGDAPTDVVVDVIEEGDGPEVKKGDWLVSNYFLQTWASKGGEKNEVENSWDNPGFPVGFTIGVGDVIKGWDESLVGLKVGSRVALTVPPDKGYGEIEGNELQKETLVFVVDVLNAVDPKATAQGSELDDVAAGSPVVSSDKDGLPKVDFADAKKPKESKATVVIEGDGPKLGDGAVVHFAQGTFAEKKMTIRTWDDNAPRIMSEANYAGIPGLADVMKDAKVGSRVMVEIAAADNPAQDGSEGEPAVLIVDLIGTYTTGA